MPCVFPLLPAIFAVSGGDTAEESEAATGRRRRVWGVVAGIELSFFVLSIFLAGAISSLGLSPNVLRYVAAALLAGFGLVLVVPKLADPLTPAISRLTSPFPPR